MKGVISAEEIHSEYERAVSAFRRQIADPVLRLRFDQEADIFFRACALGVWQKGESVTSPRYADYYNAIYTRGNPRPSILFWELAGAVADYPGFTPPDFFVRMRACDKVSGTGLARQFIELVKMMILLFAAVDSDISRTEAEFAARCADTLSRLCDADALKPGRGGMDPMDMVTRKSEEESSAALSAQEDAPAVPEPEQAVKEESKQEEKEPEPTLEELMAQLDELCGLEQVKADVRSLINLVKVRRLRESHGLPVPPMSLHLVFMGNPGTGKTTVARLLAKIYHAIGVLSKGQLVEVDRSGLVAGFVGQTAIKTGEVIKKALGGVLFIDEAYALVNQENANDFGHEAIEVLLKNMEDHRKDLIVIVAGYTGQMEKFIHSNPGLESRFNKYFYFEDYDGAQLMEIFRSMCKRNGYTLTEGAEDFAVRTLKELYEERDENFGNARDVRNFFEQSVSRQADRVAQLATPTREDLMSLTEDDLRGPEADPEPADA